MAASRGMSLIHIVTTALIHLKVNFQALQPAAFCSLCSYPVMYGAGKGTALRVGSPALSIWRLSARCCYVPWQATATAAEASNFSVVSSECFLKNHQFLIAFPDPVFGLSKTKNR